MLKFIFKHIGLLLFMMMTHMAVCQNAESIQRQNLQWYQLYYQRTLPNDLILTADGGFRFTDWMTEPSQYISRVGIGKKFSKSLTLLAGVAHLGFYSDGSLNRFEIRTYQDLLHRFYVSQIQVNQRFRTEQRFFFLKEGSSSFNWRYRYRLMASLPLVGRFEALSLQIGNELLVNGGKQARSFFDQNRVLLGPAVRISDHLSISVLYTYLVRSSSEQDDHYKTDLIWLGLQLKY